MSTSFNPGDTVQLKSGGPVMTVARVQQPTQFEPEPNVICIWFDKQARVQRGFAPATLQKVED